MSGRDGRGRFQPGQSGNPTGRPVASGIKDQIYAELALAHGTSGQTRLEAFARRLVDLCIEGDVGAMRLLLDRGWPAKLELNHDGGLTLRVIDRSDTAPVERDEAEPLPEPRAVASDEALPALDMRSAPRDLVPAPMPAAAAPVLFFQRPTEDFQDSADFD